MALYRTNCIKHYENVEVIASKSWRVFTTRRHARVAYAAAECLSVHPSVTSRGSIKMAQRSTKQTMLHNSPGILLNFLWKRSFFWISPIAVGDQITQLCPASGLTYVLQASANKFVWRDEKTAMYC